MGTVHRARDRICGSTVAVKVMPCPDEWGRVKREVEALRRIDHPNVVRMLDFGCDQDEVALVMEFVEGPTLRTLLQTTPRVPWRSAVKIAIAVLEGLGSVHEQGLVHRDIKPGNLIITDYCDPSVSIIDFGIVKPVGESRRITGFGTVVGTLAYMPPEQMLGLEHIGASADVYAVGMVLMQMICGCSPKRMGLEELGLKMRLCPRLPDSVHGGPPEQLLPILRRMLHPMPTDRIASAAECVSRLRRVLDADHEPRLRPRRRSTVELTVPCAEPAPAALGT